MADATLLAPALQPKSAQDGLAKVLTGLVKEQQTWYQTEAKFSAFAKDLAAQLEVIQKHKDYDYTYQLYQTAWALTLIARLGVELTQMAERLAMVEQAVKAR
ncbi:MAG: hypothetical protein EXR47_02880 [Dehalococcoidia bacterium]|nr:hypothetical protein [Dehalococcoidia bacterium]